MDKSWNIIIVGLLENPEDIEIYKKYINMEKNLECLEIGPLRWLFDANTFSNE